MHSIVNLIGRQNDWLFLAE